MIKDNQKTEYTLQDVFNEPEETLFSVEYPNGLVALENVFYETFSEGIWKYKQLYWTDGDKVSAMDILLNAKFIKVVK